MKTLPLTALLLLAACSSTPKQSVDDVMKGFMGSQSSDLVARWGPPQNIMKDKEGEIWIYYQNHHWVNPGYSYTTSTGSADTRGTYHGGSIFGGPGYSGNTVGQGQSQTTYMPAKTQGYTATRTFFINSQGMIYRYAWRGK